MRIKWRQHAVNLVWNHCMFTWFRKREQVCCFLFKLRFCYFIQLSLSIDFQCLTIITFGNTHVKEAINTLSDNIVWEDRYLVAKESSVRPTPCMNNCEKARLRIELKKTEMWCGAGKIREPSISNIWYYSFIGGVEVYGREIERGLSHLQIIEEDRTSVVALFLGRENVYRYTYFFLFWLTSSYVEDSNKMTVSCMFCVLQRGSWVHMVVQALWSTRAIIPTSQHITSMNIRSIFDGLACRRAASEARSELQKNRQIMWIFICM